MAERTPITLLTGCLGAGKTTLLNHLLRHPALGRAAVLVSEIGKVGVDHSRVVTPSPSLGMLPTGCLCCSPRDDLAGILRQLLPPARREEISHILIETAGTDDPASVAANLMSDRVVASTYRLDRIIAVVDACEGSAHLNGRPDAVRQVIAADWIVVSKPDLADPQPLRSRLLQLNPRAPVIAAAHGLVDAALIRPAHAAS